MSISQLLLSDENRGGNREYTFPDKELVCIVTGSVQNDSGNARLHIGRGSGESEIHIIRLQETMDRKILDEAIKSSRELRNS